MDRKKHQENRLQDVRDVPKAEQEAMLSRMMRSASAPRKMRIHNVGERMI